MHIHGISKLVIRPLEIVPGVYSADQAGTNAFRAAATPVEQKWIRLLRDTHGYALFNCHMNPYQQPQPQLAGATPAPVAQAGQQLQQVQVAAADGANALADQMGQLALQPGAAVAAGPAGGRWYITHDWARRTQFLAQQLRTGRLSMDELSLFDHHYNTTTIAKLLHVVQKTPAGTLGITFQEAQQLAAVLERALAARNPQREVAGDASRKVLVAGEYEVGFDYVDCASIFAAAIDLVPPGGNGHPIVSFKHAEVLGRTFCNYGQV